MPIEDVFSIRAGTVVTVGWSRAVVGGAEVEVVGIRLPVDGGDRGGDVPESCWMRRRRGQYWFVVAGDWEGWGAGAGGVSAGVDYAAYRVCGAVYVLTKEEGGRITRSFRGIVRSLFPTTDVRVDGLRRGWRW